MEASKQPNIGQFSLDQDGFYLDLLASLRDASHLQAPPGSFLETIRRNVAFQFGANPETQREEQRKSQVAAEFVDFLRQVQGVATASEITAFIKDALYSSTASQLLANKKALIGRWEYCKIKVYPMGSSSDLERYRFDANGGYARSNSYFTGIASPPSEVPKGFVAGGAFQNVTAPQEGIYIAGAANERGVFPVLVASFETQTTRTISVQPSSYKLFIDGDGYSPDFT